MIYGTSTSFRPEFEGRIASDVETARCPNRGRNFPERVQRVSGTAMKRQFDPAEPELMDRPQPVSAELESDLHNLRQLNRYFGSYALVRYFLRQWIRPSENLRVLDLATGSGDIPRLDCGFTRGSRRDQSIDAVDQQASTIEIAQKLSADYPEIQFHKADIFEFGEPACYDIVLCSLALHHFTRRGRRAVCSRHCPRTDAQTCAGADLRRGCSPPSAFIFSRIIFREPMTRYDGRASAARAFSFREFACARGARRLENFRPPPVPFCATGRFGWISGKDLACDLLDTRQDERSRCPGDARTENGVVALSRRWARLHRGHISNSFALRARHAGRMAKLRSAFL